MYIFSPSQSPLPQQISSSETSKLLLVFQCSGSVQGSMVACAEQGNTGVKRNLYPAHHEVVLNPNICSAMALMRCCPGRDVQALALSATGIFSQTVSFLSTFSMTGECWALRGSCQCSGAARRQLLPREPWLPAEKQLELSLPKLFSVRLFTRQGTRARRGAPAALSRPGNRLCTQSCRVSPCPDQGGDTLGADRPPAPSAPPAGWYRASPVPART